MKVEVSDLHMTLTEARRREEDLGEEMRDQIEALRHSESQKKAELIILRDQLETEKLKSEMLASELAKAKEENKAKDEELMEAEDRLRELRSPMPFPTETLPAIEISFDHSASNFNNLEKDLTFTKMDNEPILSSTPYHKKIK